jgi:hypothetical protein
MRYREYADRVTSIREAITQLTVDADSYADRFPEAQRKRLWAANRALDNPAEGWPGGSSPAADEAYEDVASTINLWYAKLVTEQDRLRFLRAISGDCAASIRLLLDKHPREIPP